MKKLLLAAIGLSMGIVYTACEKEDNFTKSNQTDLANKYSTDEGGQNNEVSKCLMLNNNSVPYNQQKEDMIREDMQMLALGFVELAKDPQFVNIVKREVEKEFDGDNNVLLSELELKCEMEGVHLTEKMKHSIGKHGTPSMKKNLHRLNGMINRIAHYSGEDLYPQIFIPFYSTVDHSINPIVAPHVEINEDETIDGIELVKSEKNNQETIMIKKITEDIASQQPIWIISINESVDCNGRYNANSPVRSGDIKAYEARGRASSGPVKFLEFRPYMTIGDKKESWIKGKADVAWVFSQYDPISPCSGPYSYTAIDGDVKKFSKSMINVQQEDIHVEFASSWIMEQPTIALLIYERDSWPSKKKYWYFATNDCALVFRSSADAYYLGHHDWYYYVATGSWQGTETINDSPGQINFWLNGREI